MYVIFRRKTIMIREWRYQMPYGTDWQSGFFWWLYFFIFFFTWDDVVGLPGTGLCWAHIPPLHPASLVLNLVPGQLDGRLLLGCPSQADLLLVKKMNLLLETNFHWLYMKSFSVFSSLCIFCLFVFCFIFFFGGGCYFKGGGVIRGVFWGVFWVLIVFCFLLFLY